MRNRLAAVLTVLTLCGSAVNGQMIFRKAEIHTGYGAAEQGADGKIIVNRESIRFTKNNEREDYFSIPTDSVTELFYSRVSGRRIVAAILISPLLLFTKGRKHYLTMTFDDGANHVGAVEFQLHKSNYRGVLRGLEQVTGLIMKYDQEGVKDTAQTVATRRDAIETGLDISSDPAGAEIDIDGAFVGQTPRKRRVLAGKHKVRIRLKGYKEWERTVDVQEGELLPISASLEER